MEKEFKQSITTQEDNILEIETQDMQETAVSAEKEKKWSLKGKILGIVIALIALGGIGYTAYVILSGQRTISTGNASVRTNLIYITANAPGYLERFNVYSGMLVETGQILGWLQGGEPFRSPIDGIIVNTQAVVGQQIRPMEPLATIADVNNLHIQANIYESDIQDIKLGQPVAVTLDGVRGQTFAGYVRYINRITELELAGGAIMVQTGTFRRITHTIPVEIAITDDIDLSHFLGTNARVSLPVLSSEEELITVVANNKPTNQITATGHVESVTARNIYPSHALRIDEVLVRLGDSVEAGQVLATLDISDLETSITTHRVAIDQMDTQSHIQRQETQRMLDTALRNMNNNTNISLVDAQAHLTASRLQRENAQRMYNQIRLDYENRTDPQVAATESVLRTITLELERLRSNYSNVTTLYNAGVSTRQELQQLSDALVATENQFNDATINHQNALEAERRNLEQMRVALDSANVAYTVAAEMVHSVEVAARQEIEGLQASLAEMARIDGTEQLRHYLAQMERHLEDGVITTPIGGTITAVHAEPGEFSLARLFTIETLDELRVLANIREFDLPNIYVGQSVTVTAYATGGQIHTGIITLISPRAVSTFPVVEFQIEIAITSDYALLPGMSARIQIDLD